MPISYQIAVLLHVLAAVVWVGGLLFLGGVALPASRTLDDEQRAREIVRLLGQYFRPIGWSALAVLVASGAYMMWIWGARPGNIWDGTFFGTIRARWLGIKVLLVGLMIAVSGLHDWYVGPKASSLESEGETERAGRWRIYAAVLGAVTALLAVAVVLLASVIARPWMNFGY